MKQNQYHLAAKMALLVTLAAPACVHAQYVWIDDKGLKQLSDQPPPPSVPQNRILRQPRNAQLAPAPAAVDDPAAQAGAPTANNTDKGKRPPTLAERNVDYTKRQAESAAAAAKAAQESAQRAADAANCDSARSNQMALDSGQRMSTFDKNGQRTFLTDSQRAERSKQNQSVLANCPR